MLRYSEVRKLGRLVWTSAARSTPTHAGIEADEEVLPVSFESCDADAEVGRRLLLPGELGGRTHESLAWVAVDLGIANECGW